MFRPTVFCSLLSVVWLLGAIPLHVTGQATQSINGQWTDWSKVSSTCSRTCGGGTLMRVRTCTNPAPTGNGTLCKMENGTLANMEMKLFNCSVQSCWTGMWSNWTNCSAECDWGTQERYAICDNETETLCTGDQAMTNTTSCSTWNITTCPDPCLTKKCPTYSVCRNESTAEKPVATCVCTMGYKLIDDICQRPPPTPPTERPIPTLPPVQKVIATVISKTASTILIVCVSFTLVFFILMRIFTIDRIIQMNMEIALLAAHLVLLFPSSTASNVTLCRVVSIMIHFFITSCFMFMMLEALHMYAMVASVVRRDGLFTKGQNLGVGWGVPAFVVLFTMCFIYPQYGGAYHCFLRMDGSISWAQQIPIISLMIITFTLTEAAGVAEYKQLLDVDKAQLISAKFSQRTNLFILPVVYIHWLLGALSEYQQNMALYSFFTIASSCLGVMVLIMHCSNNAVVRERLMGLVRKVMKKDKPELPVQAASAS